MFTQNPELKTQNLSKTSVGLWTISIPPSLQFQPIQYKVNGYKRLVRDVPSDLAVTRKVDRVGNQDQHQEREHH